MSTKTVLVTGGARRIGRCLVEHLHAAGFNVLLHCNQSVKPAQEIADLLNQSRPNSVMVYSAQLLDLSAIRELATVACDQWGRLDVLINNASTFYPTRIEEISEQHWHDLIGVNLKAPLFLSQACAPVLKTHRGCIINIVDIHSLRPLKDYPLYSIAKAGLAMLTKALARELAPEVRVNGISPGAILWPELEAYEGMHQDIIDKTALKREGNPLDIAKTAQFLIESADYITGQIIAVDGGRTLSN